MCLQFQESLRKTMSDNPFIWSDLSTYDLGSAKQFYRACFDWEYRELGDSYFACVLRDGYSSSGVYAMPEKFQSMGMLSFWMSYIQVDDIQHAVASAEQCGGKVEVHPQAAPGGGLVALIRDPMGAGFTCYEGDPLGAKEQLAKAGSSVWNELHVSDVSKIKPFYTDVFGWDIRATGTGNRYEIFASPSDAEPIAGVQQADNREKGDKEYWGVYFAVQSLSKTVELIERQGGQVGPEQQLGSQRACLAFDSQGAAFYILEAVSNELPERKSSINHAFKWRATLGLLLVVAAVLFEANWIWGALFLFWVIPDIKSGRTYFLELVERQHNPVHYWLIVSAWVVLSVYLLLGGAF